MAPSLKNFFTTNGLLTEAYSDRWKQSFLVGEDGMPQTSREVLDYVEDIYINGFNGRNNVDDVNVPLIKWLIHEIDILGLEDIDHTERNELITVVKLYSVTKDESSIIKMGLKSAFAMAQKDFGIQKQPEKPKETPIIESPIPENIKELVDRVYDVPDGSGRVWVRVKPGKSGKFFDTLCALGNTHGIRCQATGPNYRGSNMLTYTLIGPKNGTDKRMTSLLSLSIENGNISDAKQVENQPIGSPLYGWNDLDELFVKFLGTPELKATLKSINGNVSSRYSGAEFFVTMFANRKLSIMNLLHSLRPDIIENSKYTIEQSGGAEWLRSRNLDAVQALKKLGPEQFIIQMDKYVQSPVFKDAFRELLTYIPQLSKTNPEIVMNKIEYFLDSMPVIAFNDMITKIDLNNYINTHKEEFKNLLKKLTIVNSKEAKQYKEVGKQILDRYFDIISNSYGQGLIGIKKMMGFLEMPKSNKHEFVKKDETGQIWIKKPIVKREGGIEEITYETVPLQQEQAITTQKERRDLIKKHEPYIKSLLEGDEEKKHINFLRMLFGETNPQDIQRTLKAEKERFIQYYNTHHTKYGQVAGIPFPGIFEFYRMFNKGKTIQTSIKGGVMNLPTNRYGEQEETEQSLTTKPYYKFDTEDIRNPEIERIIQTFFAKIYLNENKLSKLDVKGIYVVLEDFANMLKVSGESPETITQKIKKYKPTLLPTFKNAPKIPYSAYEKYYDLLNEFGNSTSTSDDISLNKEEIESKLDRKETATLLAKFGKKYYNVKVQDMVEYLGQNDINDMTDIYLEPGRKYSVVEVSDDDISENILNSKITVIDDRKRLSDWINTSYFKIPLMVLAENFNITNHIRKVLLENNI